jgi:hypothetical protein
MDILRNLFGSLTAGIIRLLVTVGILGAVYLLIVKPVLKTTSDISHEANSTFQKSFGEEGSFSDIGNSIEDVNRQVQREVRRSFHQSRQQGDADKLVHCIKRAHQNVNRIQRCSNRFG